MRSFFTAYPWKRSQQYLQKSLTYRQLTIHLYHPRNDLGGMLGILNFDRDRIQTLIEQGFNDTVNFNHDTDTVVRPIHLPRCDHRQTHGGSEEHGQGQGGG